jgi:hypothetical protein
MLVSHPRVVSVYVKKTDSLFVVINLFAVPPSNLFPLGLTVILFVEA